MTFEKCFDSIWKVTLSKKDHNRPLEYLYRQIVDHLGKHPYQTLMLGVDTTYSIYYDTERIYTNGLYLNGLCSSETEKLIKDILKNTLNA